MNILFQQRALLCALDLLYLGVTIEISAPGGGTTGPPATIIKVATKILKFIFHAVCLKAYPQRPEIKKNFILLSNFFKIFVYVENAIHKSTDSCHILLYV